MAVQVQDGVPRVVVAGDLWAWTVADVSREYPVADYNLKIAMSPVVGGSPVVVDAVSEGEKHKFSKSDTSAIAAGEYQWSLFAVETGGDGSRHSIGSGDITVKPDPITSTIDPRTDKQKALAAIEAVLAKRASKDQENYAIEGRSLSRTPISDLIRLRNFYRNEVADEAAVASGVRRGNKRKTRFV